jgi:hypothetical protein
MKTPTIFNQSGAKRREIQLEFINENLKVIETNFIEQKQKGYCDMVLITEHTLDRSQINTAFINHIDIKCVEFNNLYSDSKSFFEKNKTGNIIPIIFFEEDGQMDTYAIKSTRKVAGADSFSGCGEFKVKS